MLQTIEYTELVRAAHDTARKLLNRGDPSAPIWNVIVDTHGGQTACVNWDHYSSTVRMSLPSFAPDTRLTRIEADRIVGLIAHETLHVLYTDNKVWQRAVAMGVSDILNCIEDVRIEAKEIGTGYLPNLLSVLSDTLDWKHGEALDECARRGVRPPGRRIRDIPYLLCVMGRLANGYRVPCTAGIRQDLSPEVAAVVDATVARMPALRSTEDALDLALFVQREMARLKAAQPPSPPSLPGNGTDEAGEAGEAGEGEAGEGEAGESEAGQNNPASSPRKPADGPAAPSGDQDSGQDTKAAGEAPTGTSEDAAGAEGADPSDETGAGGEKEPADTLATQATLPNDEADAPELGADTSLDSLADKVRERTGDKADHGHLSELTTFGGGRRMVSAGSRRDPDRAELFLARLRRGQVNPAKLRTQIAQLIKSLERHGKERFRTVGRLDRRALARMGAGAPNVFTRRTFVPGVDTAVCVLADCSGSMSGQMHLMQAVILHLAEAIDAARGKLAIAGFIGARADTILQIAKGWGDRFDPLRMIGWRAQQSTPMSTSILAACDLLKEVSADRRILLVLTDGGCDLGPKCVQAAVKLANARGVEVAGVGIGCEVDYAFPISAGVRDLSHLTDEGLGVLVKALEAA